MNLTKKNVFWGSLCGVLIILLSLSLVLSNSCGYYDEICKNVFVFLAGFLFISPFVFLFSLITYFLREEVFQYWLRFVKWWIPLSIFLVLIIPDGQGGGYMPSLVDKQVIAFLMSAIFVLVSVTKIISKSIELRKKTKTTQGSPV